MNLSGGPCKIRLIAPSGVRVVRICEPGQVDALVAEHKQEGYTLDRHELAVGGGKRTTNPSRL